MIITNKMNITMTQLAKEEGIAVYCLGESKLISRDREKLAGSINWETEAAIATLLSHIEVVVADSGKKRAGLYITFGDYQNAWMDEIKSRQSWKLITEWNSTEHNGHECYMYHYKPNEGWAEKAEVVRERIES